jgi:hypothetical protein
MQFVTACLAKGFRWAAADQLAHDVLISLYYAFATALDSEL